LCSFITAKQVWRESKYFSKLFGVRKLLELKIFIMKVKLICTICILMHLVILKFLFLLVAVCQTQNTEYLGLLQEKCSKKTGQLS
jgi:uncharacterized membrane protein